MIPTVDRPRWPELLVKEQQPLQMKTGCSCLRNLLIVMALLASGLDGDRRASAAERSTSPDGKETYVCGDERDSHSGCYTHWVRTADANGRWDNWRPGWCPSEQPNGGMCWGGGVAWWYWKGVGEIGDQILKDFWVRDYANLEDRSKSPENPYGDAKKILGQGNCYQASSFKVCIAQMNPVQTRSKSEGIPLPFAPNPTSFAQYMSKQEWSGTKWQGKAEFLQLSGCSFGKWKYRRVPGSTSFMSLEGEANPYAYTCKSGYARQTMPMGTKVCEINTIRYYSPHVVPADDFVGTTSLSRIHPGLALGPCSYLSAGATA